jgi:L-ascorbate metabolism protein UlaG (beta-lactamase superfamily)
MSTDIRWLGHSAIEIVTSGSTLLIDPFFTGNPTAPIAAADLKPDFILVSHGHGDHVGDTIDIAKRTGATVITNFEISQWLLGQGVEKVHGLQHGGGVDLPFGRVKLTLAFHGSVLPDGTYGGNPAGFLIKTKDGFTIYDAADTGLFGDMSLIGEENVDLAFLPIGDYYTMGPEDALKAVRLIHPKQVVPIHFDTFPPIRQDGPAWANLVRRETGVDAVALNPGEGFTLKKA